MPSPAILDAWREQGADRIDPLAFHYMVALQRRVARQDGDARLVLEEKLSARINAYAETLERATPDIADASHATTRTMLVELVDELSSRSAARNSHTATADTAPGCALSEMGVLDDFRKIWSSVHTNSQIRRSLEHSPENAGPLNSSSLVHRSLTLMREVSPGYLRQFMSYVDALSWLEQLNGCGVLAAKGASPPASGRARAPRKQRKRREPV
jgi:Protein of unknown function (DUF2894).